LKGFTTGRLGIKDIPLNHRYNINFSRKLMNHRLLDAVDLLKMLEVVFEQRQALELNGERLSRTNSNASDFPWSGVRLTLRQAREMLQEMGISPEPVKVPAKIVASNQNSDHAPFEAAVRQSNGSRPKVSQEAIRTSVSEGPNAERTSMERPNPERPNPERPVRSENTRMESAEKNYRGTFNRIQLTQEPATTTEEPVAQVTTR
jgi:hypothetical protein